MGLNIGTLSGYLELEDRLTPALRLAEQRLITTGQGITSVGKQATALGNTLLPLSAALIATGGAATFMSGEFQASMTKLVSTAGVLSNEIDDVREHILKMAPAVGIGPQALADAMTKVSSTVGDTATALGILDTAAQGTKAGFGATVDVAGALTTVINSYGLSAGDAAHAGDVLAQAIKEGGAEAKELAPTLANVVPFAAQLGVSFEEVAANIATMTKLGVPTAEAVTSLTSVFTALSKETKSGTDQLFSMGLSYDGLRKSIREQGLAATLQDLKDRFGDNVSAMTDVFGRVEAVKNIMGTAGVQGATYADVLSKIKGSSDSAGGALKNMADAMTGTTVQNWSQFTAQVQVLAIRFGDVLAPALSKMLDIATPVLDWAESAVGLFTKLPEPVQLTAIAIAGLGASAGPALIALGSISSVVGLASKGLGMLTGVFAGAGAASVKAAVDIAKTSAATETAKDAFEALFTGTALAAPKAAAGVASVGVAAEGASIGFGAAALSALPFAAAIAGIGIAVAAAAFAIQKWNMDNESLASNLKQGRVDVSEMAIAAEMAGHSFDTLDQALEYLRTHVKDQSTGVVQLRSDWQAQRDEMAAVTAATDAAAAKHEEYNKKVADMVTTVRQSNEEQENQRAAFEKAGLAIAVTQAGMDTYIPMLDKVIESGRALTEQERNYYDAVTASRQNITSQGEALLKLHGITLDQIEAMRQQGLSESEIAEKLGVTTTAVGKYADELKTLKDVTTEYTSLQIKMSGTALDAAKDAHQKEYQDAVDKLDKTSLYYNQTMHELAKLRDAKTAAEGSSWDELSKTSKRSLDEQADAAQRDYDRMASSTDGFTREQLQKQLEKIQKLRAEAGGYGDSMVDAQDRAAAAAKQHNDELEKQKAKIDAAKKAYEAMMAMGNTLEVNRSNLMSPDIGYGPGASGGNMPNSISGVSKGDIDRLAQQGFSLANAIAILSPGGMGMSAALNGGWQGPRGPAIPGYPEWTGGTSGSASPNTGGSSMPNTSGSMAPNPTPTTSGGGGSSGMVVPGYTAPKPATPAPRTLIRKSPPDWLGNVTYFYSDGTQETRYEGTSFGLPYAHAATGGMVMVGEDGPEMVQLPFGSQVFPNGTRPASAGGMQMFNTWNVNGTGEQVAAVVMEKMTRLMMLGRKWPSA